LFLALSGPLLDVGVVVAATASALPQVLPETSGKSSEAISTAEPKLVTLGGSVITCVKAKGTTTETGSTPLGLFHITFEKCTTVAGGVTVPCTGLGDATSGEILTLGEYHLVYDKNSVELPVAILFLIEHVHFTCGGIVLVLVLGSELCLILEPYVLKTLHEFHCIQSGGDPTDTKYLTDTTGVEATSGLKCSTSEGAEESCAELALALILWRLNNANVDVLIMMS
jgi:hypothetical protein